MYTYEYVSSFLGQNVFMGWYSSALGAGSSRGTLAEPEHYYFRTENKSVGQTVYYGFITQLYTIH